MLTFRMSLNSQPYLNLFASLNSLLLRVRFISFKGKTLSQLEASFSFINSTAHWVFKGRDLVTYSRSCHALSAFSWRTHRCMPVTSSSLGGSTACLTICFTRGAVALMDASYSCCNWLMESTRLRSPMGTGSTRRSCSVPVTWCSKRAGIRTSEMVRSKKNCKCKFNVKHRECLLNHPSQRLMIKCLTIPDRIGIWNCWFLRGGENRSTRRKTSRSKEEKQCCTEADDLCSSLLVCGGFLCVKVIVKTRAWKRRATPYSLKCFCCFCDLICQQAVYHSIDLYWRA